MTGIALPILGGIWLTPGAKSQAFAIDTLSARTVAHLFQHGRDTIGSLSAGVARRHLSGGGAAPSSARYG